jgi:hypothetical protein
LKCIVKSVAGPEKTNKEKEMNTIATLAEKFPIGDLSHLDDIEIPVSSGPNAQGDLSWFPLRSGKVAGLKPIPQEGVVILSGNNGHPHTLFSLKGECSVALNLTQEQRLATVVVPEGAELLVAHNEHGYHVVGEGTFQFNCAFEYRTELRRLAD